jgi:hypothetical protein
MPALFLAASNIKRRTMARGALSPLRYSHLQRAAEVAASKWVSVWMHEATKVVGAEGR